LAGIYFMQAIVIILLAKDQVFPVHVSFPVVDPIASDMAGHQLTAMASRHLLDAHLSYLIAFFLLIPAVVHGLIASFYRREYQAGLQKRVNVLRWISFGMSAALMVVSIALVSGITNLSTLIPLAVLALVGAASALISELLPPGITPIRKVIMVIGYGSLIGAAAVAVLQVWSGAAYGHFSGYVYGIYASMFGLVLIGVLHYVRQQQGKGRWANYIWAEYGYIILELVIGTALAWQLFAGALRP